MAGAAALVRDYYPTLSAREVADRLLGTADHPSTPLPTKLVGYDVIGPMAAVTTIPNVDAPSTPVPEDLTVPKTATRTRRRPPERCGWPAASPQQACFSLGR